MAQCRTKVSGVHIRAGALAGAATWIVEGEVRGRTLWLTRALGGADLPGGGVERELLFPALRRYCATRESAVVGLDAAFGLGRRVAQTDQWAKFLTGFRRRFANAVALRELGSAAAKGRDASRGTDRQLGRRSEPHKRRTAHQTYHCVADVLAPLVEADAARIVPMQEPVRGKTIVCEVAPAARLRRESIAFPLKGNNAIATGTRLRLLEALQVRGELGGIELIESAVSDDAEADLAWAVVCAVIAARVARGESPQPSDGWIQAEGWAYA